LLHIKTYFSHIPFEIGLYKNKTKQKQNKTKNKTKKHKQKAEQKLLVEREISTFK